MKLIIISGIVLALLLAGSYYSLKHIKETKQVLLEEFLIQDSLAQVDIPLSPMDSLKLVVENMKDELTGKSTELDSVKNEIPKQVASAKEEITKTMEEKNVEKENEAEAANAKHMAKTFENMSIKQIGPILNNLDDVMVFKIYKQTGNRFKKNILLAVNEKRAAMITERFITQQ